jgi:hypothetical protein
MTVKLPTPFEPLVSVDGKINEVWYRHFSESALALNGATTSITALSTGVIPAARAKAWGLVRVTTAGVMTLSTGYNVTSATTDGGAGTVTVNLTVPFASSDYTVLPSITNQTSAGSNNVPAVGALASSQFSLIVFNSSGENHDPAAWHFACYGDQ